MTLSQTSVRSTSECLTREDLRNSNLIRGGMSDIEKCQATWFHAWVEDQQGNVVFDPEFVAEYGFFKRMNGCDRETPMVHHRYENQKECAMVVMKQAIQRAISLERIGFPPQYRAGFCSINCHYFMRENKGKGFKVVVGAAGWKKKKGGIHFEWG